MDGFNSFLITKKVARFRVCYFVLVDRIRNKCGETCEHLCVNALVINNGLTSRYYVGNYCIHDI